MTKNLAMIRASSTQREEGRDGECGRTALIVRGGSSEIACGEGIKARWDGGCGGKVPREEG